MREQDEGGGLQAGRRGGVVRALLGLGEIAEGAPAADVGVPRKPGAGDGGEERKAVVRVVAADMPPALQRRAFRCARDELAATPRSPRRLEPKRLALALKKNSISVPANLLRSSLTIHQEEPKNRTTRLLAPKDALAEELAD